MCLVWVSDRDSTPPPMAMFISPVMMPLAAMPMLIRPEAHMRSTAMPGTLSGKPPV
ncbi:hypothetical protein D3C76_1050280 [compost metagenome]